VSVALVAPAGMSTLRSQWPKSAVGSAVPASVHQRSVVACGAGAERLTVNASAVVPLLPSVTLTSAMLAVAAAAHAGRVDEPRMNYGCIYLM
jgi:hypothetical protein